ncbi:MAG: Spi family protease inhibitor, partial [Kiritimatiellae bacterium]|nr:Spi family protease inhibitor [Kiritimatiellia bacterium]
MNKTRMALGAMALAVLAAFGAWATPVDEATARTAAERFLQTSKMAARTLPERTVATIAARGNLWVVRLAPSGHILLSGSDRATPIIGFSQNDFSEGEEDSAERAMLDAADEAVAAAEADETKGRHARWDSLLAEPETSAGTKVRKLLSAGSGSGSDINIEPFVDSKYNQNQPWNDLTPVTAKGVDPYNYRGRSCAGCVSIADAAIFRELNWPVYPARNEAITHTFRGNTFNIRFD